MNRWPLWLRLLTGVTVAAAAQQDAETLLLALTAPLFVGGARQDYVALYHPFTKIR